VGAGLLQIKLVKAEIDCGLSACQGDTGFQSSDEVEPVEIASGEPGLALQDLRLRA
jgi:hypothetical protein